MNTVPEAVAFRATPVGVAFAARLTRNPDALVANVGRLERLLCGSTNWGTRGEHYDEKPWRPQVSGSLCP